MKKIILIALLSLGTIIITTGTNIRVLYSYSPDKSPVGLNDQQQKKDSDVKTVYTCPMHQEIVQDKAGKCPKCGMNLKAKEVKKNVYTCPMHPEVVSDKPGKCPKCGMNIALKESPKNSPKK